MGMENSPNKIRVAHQRKIPRKIRVRALEVKNFMKGQAERDRVYASEGSYCERNALRRDSTNPPKNFPVLKKTLKRSAHSNGWPLVQRRTQTASPEGHQDQKTKRRGQGGWRARGAL